MNTRYALKAVNDEQTVCSRCGRTELKRVMWLAELDADGNEGEVFAVGTACGAKLLAGKGIDPTLAKYASRNFTAMYNKTVDQAAAAHPEYAGYCERMDALIKRVNGLSMPFSERVALPEWDELVGLVNRIYAEARATAQVILE